MMLFEETFYGSIRCANAVKLALNQRRRHCIIHNSIFNDLITLEMALTVTVEELKRLPNCGKMTVSEFKSWKDRHQFEGGEWSISHWGLVSIDSSPYRGEWD